MVDRIEELLSRMEAEEDAGREEDVLAVPGETSVSLPRPPDGGAAGSSQGEDGVLPRDGLGASGEGPEGPELPAGDGPDGGLGVSWPELSAPAPLPPPERGEDGGGELPALGTASGGGAGADWAASPPAAGEAASGLETLYRETARAAMAPAVLPYPAGGRSGLGGRIQGPGSAASLAVDELDRAVRRDSRRYDGEMRIY